LKPTQRSQENTDTTYKQPAQDTHRTSTRQELHATGCPSTPFSLQYRHIPPASQAAFHTSWSIPKVI